MKVRKIPKEFIIIALCSRKKTRQETSQDVDGFSSLGGLGGTVSAEVHWAINGGKKVLMEGEDRVEEGREERVRDGKKEGRKEGRGSVVIREVNHEERKLGSCSVDVVGFFTFYRVAFYKKKKEIK